MTELEYQLEIVRTVRDLARAVREEALEVAAQAAELSALAHDSDYYTVAATQIARNIRALK